MKNKYDCGEVEQRMEMILDDLNQLVNILRIHDLLPNAQPYINNIEISCDLNSDECLGWTPYSSNESEWKPKKLELVKYEGKIWSKNSKEVDGRTEYFDLTTESKSGEIFSKYDITSDEEIYKEDIEELLPHIEKVYGGRVIHPNPNEYQPKPVLKLLTVKESICKHLQEKMGFKHHVSKSTDFDLIVLEIELDKTYNKRIRVVLDDEGETKSCGVKVIGFTYNYIIEWETSFGHGTPLQSIYTFIQSIS